MNETGSVVDFSPMVLRGLDATTFSDMEAFVAELEERPLDRLLHDLPQLLFLSSTKVSLVSYVVKGKFRQADVETRNAMRESIATTVESLPGGDARQKCVAILARLR